MKRGLAKQSRKSLRSHNTHRLHFERLENRQLLTAALSINNPLLVFNAVKGSSSPTETVIFTNTGNSTLTFGSSAFSVIKDPSITSNDTARFSLLNSSSAPASLAPGQNFTLNINYNANAVLNNSALLDVSTNDAAHPVQVITLHGIGTQGLGGTNQPSLARILRAYDIPTIVGQGPNDSNAATDSNWPTAANPVDPSSQEVVAQRFVKAGAGPISINVLASFTASGFSKSYVLGTYPAGDPTDLNQLFYTTASENQTTYVQPQGATSFDPGTTPFGFYFVSNVQTAGRIGYSEDALNTWDTNTGRHMRFYPMETPSGAIVPNTYIMTSTEWNAPVGYDFTNIVAVVSNISIAPSSPTAPVLTLQNPDAVPGSSTMVFNRIGIPNTAVGDIVHDTGVLDVTDTGGSPLVISSYSLSSQWTLVNPPSFPLTINPGATVPLTIKFIANSVPSVPYNETNDIYYPKGGGVYDGSLTLNTNDPTNAKSVTSLAGYFQTQSENSEEPGLQTIVNLMYGWGTDINSTPISNLNEGPQNSGSTPVYYGEEVVSPYWQEADTGQSVTVEQIAAFHTQGNTATTYWYPQGGSTKSLFSTVKDDGQSLFPDKTGTTTPAEASFSTTGIFGFNVDGYYSDNSKNAQVPGGGHHLRFYPVRTASGVLVPNTYIMAMDYGIIPENYDFQDNLYLVTNIRPSTVVAGTESPQTTGAPPTPADFYAAGTQNGVSLEWAPVTDSTLRGYNVYRSSSEDGPYTLLTPKVITATSYLDTTAPSGPEYYKVTSFDNTTLTESLAAFSSTTALITSTTVPPAPGNLTATGITGAVSLTWSAVADPTLEGYDVYSSSSASGPFTLLTPSVITATSFTDSSATVGATTYYQVTAVDASSGLSSTPSTASGTALAVVGGLQSVDIGATPSGSTTIVNPGTDYNVTAGGPGIANNADGFRFLYASQSGDFDVKVQVQSITVAGNYATAGILARTSLTTTSPDVYMSASPVNYRFKYRTTTAGVNNIAVGGNTSFPGAWVRLTRVGNLFTGYSSTDGVHWTAVSSITIALPSTLYLGLGVASNNNTQTTTTQLRGYGVTNVTVPTPPPTPANFAATGIHGGVSLAWSAVADATLQGYNIYSSGSANGTYTKLTSTPITATSFTDNSAVIGQTTFYKVTAVDASSGLESAAATASATALAVVVNPPPTPASFTATGIQGAVSLSWSAVSDATLKGYNVYSSSSSSGPFTKLTSSPITATTYVDSSAVVGQTTFYEVTAVDASSGLESTPATASGTALTVVVNPPPTPANFTATGIQGAVSLSWSAVSDATLKGYNVYSSSSSSGPFTKLTSSPITATTYVDSSAVVGQTTFYEVTAVDASSGLESTPATASGTALAVVVNPPATPANFTATGIQGGVSLAWSAVADATLKGYNLYSSSSVNGTYTLLTSSPITATTYTDNAATVGVTTFYRVTSVDASSGLESSPASASGTALSVVNNGLTSVDIGATPSGSTTVINAGTDYNVTAGGPGIAANADGFRFLYQTQTGDFDMKVQVQSITVAGNYSTAGILARTSLTTTSPDVYMSASPVNYRFKYRTTTAGVNNIAVGGNTSFPGAWVRLVRAGNLFTGYSSTDGVHWTAVSSITIALPSTLYLGLGVASNNSTQTTTAQLRSYGPTNGTTATPPAAPANLSATGIQGGVSLAWSAVADATLKGYNVYSSSSASGTYTLLTASPIAATSFTDNSAVLGQTTYYKVTAVDAASGLESAAATASATALGVASSPPAAPTNVAATDIQGGVSLSWSAVSDSTLKGYNVYSSSSPSGNFTLLTSSPITSTAFTDPSAVFGVTTYYRVTAVDASSGLESAAAAVTATGLQSMDIGATPSGSTTVVTPGSAYNVTAGGPGVANNADGFRFIYESFTGNFDLKVQVQSLTVAGNYSTAGILARTSLTTNSPDIYMSASPVNYRFKYRNTVGGVNNIAVAGSTSFPGAWVRLSRVGNLFTGYYSADGVHWTVAYSYTLALPNTLYLGLAVASNVSTTTTSAVLSDFSTT